MGGKWPTKFLVVDDDKMVAETLCTIFVSAGYIATHAPSGQEAIARVESFRPNLLVCDIVMPGLNGFETALRVKELCPECLLLFLSGQALTVEIAESFGQIFNDRGFSFELLAKPVYPDELLRRVRNALSSLLKSDIQHRVVISHGSKRTP
jgi:CheY-like chemotaxis protein